jgi:hypothetical protein
LPGVHRFPEIAYWTCSDGKDDIKSAPQLQSGALGCLATQIRKQHKAVTSIPNHSLAPNVPVGFMEWFGAA